MKLLTVKGKAMQTVWKYEIKPNSHEDEPYPIEILAPQGALPLHVGMQHGSVCLWAEVDPSKPKTTLKLCSVGTGFGAVPDNAKYIGTVQQGGFVWHIYWQLV